MGKHAVLLAMVALTMGTPALSNTEVTEPIELTFGVYSSDKATVMYKMFIPIIRQLQENAEAKLKHPVDIFIKIFRTYDEGIDALVKGDVDLVRFGPASYILAKAKISQFVEANDSDYQIIREGMRISEEFSPPEVVMDATDTEM